MVRLPEGPGSSSLHPHLGLHPSGFPKSPGSVPFPASGGGEGIKGEAPGLGMALRDPKGLSQPFLVRVRAPTPNKPLSGLYLGFVGGVGLHCLRAPLVKGHGPLTRSMCRYGLDHLRKRLRAGVVRKVVLRG